MFFCMWWKTTNAGDSYGDPLSWLNVRSRLSCGTCTYAYRNLAYKDLFHHCIIRILLLLLLLLLSSLLTNPMVMKSGGTMLPSQEPSNNHFHGSNHSYSSASLFTLPLLVGFDLLPNSLPCIIFLGYLLPFFYNPFPRLESISSLVSLFYFPYYFHIRLFGILFYFL